jgi:hypothetical protein
MTRFQQFALALVGLFLIPATTRADVTLWVDDSNGEIGKVQVSTGQVTLVGNAGVVLTDIAFDPNGNLYGVSFTDLYKIDKTTGVATDLGTIANGAGVNFNALVFGTNGVLYAAGTTSTHLYSINIGTVTATNLGNVGADSGGDLAFVGGNLYLSSSSDHLIRINNPSGPATGTDIGPIGYPNVFGLASPDGATLYGVAGTQVLKIDPSTGQGTLVSDYGGQGLHQAYGESFISEAVAAPEPSSIVVAGLGSAILLGFSALRRRAASK